MNHEPTRCQVTRSANSDPAGDWAIECGAEGEYCPVCKLVTCSYCHRLVATQPHGKKKVPASASTLEARRKIG